LYLLKEERKDKDQEDKASLEVCSAMLRIGYKKYRKGHYHTRKIKESLRIFYPALFFFAQKLTHEQKGLGKG